MSKVLCLRPETINSEETFKVSSVVHVCKSSKEYTLRPVNFSYSSLCYKEVRSVRGPPYFYCKDMRV